MRFTVRHDLIGKFHQFEGLQLKFILGHLMTWNFLDSNEASFNTPDLVTSSTSFFATYLADSIFNIPVSFCLMLTQYQTK